MGLVPKQTFGVCLENGDELASGKVYRVQTLSYCFSYYISYTTFRTGKGFLLKKNISSKSVFIIPFTRQVDWKVVPLTFSVFYYFILQHRHTSQIRLMMKKKKNIFFLSAVSFFYFYIVIVLLQKHLKLVGHIECERVAPPFSRNPPCRSLQARSICQLHIYITLV